MRVSPFASTTTSPSGVEAESEDRERPKAWVIAEAVRAARGEESTYSHRDSAEGTDEHRTDEHRTGAESTATVELRERVDDLEARVEALEAEVEQKDERIADLEAQVADLEARGEAATRKRNHLAEELERIEREATDVDGAADEEDQDAEPGTDTPQTPLEQVVGLPEPLAAEELTANQERARFVAQDVRDYAERVPAGYAIPSTVLRKVLKAKDGSTPHTQTVARVMDFLDELYRLADRAVGVETMPVDITGAIGFGVSGPYVPFRIQRHQRRAQAVVRHEPLRAVL